MAITPTPHLFTAISAADLAKSAGRGTAQARSSAAGGGEKPDGQSFHSETGQAQRTEGPQKSAESKLDASTTKTTADPSEPSVAPEFRREAVGPSRPQFERLGQKVDLSV